MLSHRMTKSKFQSYRDSKEKSSSHTNSKRISKDLEPSKDYGLVDSHGSEAIKIIVAENTTINLNNNDTLQIKEDESQNASPDTILLKPAERMGETEVELKLKSTFAEEMTNTGKLWAENKRMHS